MTDSLLIFTISPVQDFIAEARRAHDLWAGSQILVELIRAAAQSAERAATKNGGKLIYPANLSQTSLPNIFVAQLGVNGDAAKQIARDAETALNRRWIALHTSARARLESKIAVNETWKTLWDDQVARQWEIYWSIGPGDVSNYAEWYKQTWHGLQARKATRTFAPAHEEGPKDSLSGTRAALSLPKIDGDDPNDSPAKAYWKRIGNAFAEHDPDDRGNVPTILLPNGRERLDAIGATKRFAEELDVLRFPSTSSIAAAEFRRRVKTQGVEAMLKQYAHLLSDITDWKGCRIFEPKDGLRCNQLAAWTYDGDLFFSEALEPQALVDNYRLDELARDDKNLAAARDFLPRLHQAAGGEPSTYYTILVMDGDHMGDHIRACKSADDHHALSEQLAGFAKRTYEIVEANHAGRVVYAGGDDLLALVPLADALPAARDLRQAFVDAVPGATISAGVAIAHHQAPLDAALQAAHQAEELAKNQYGRDALCVTALKRSGETTRVGARWFYDALDSVGILLRVRNVLQSGALASKFPFDALAEAPALVNLPVDAQKAALKRLLARHANPQDAASVPTAEELGAFTHALDADAPRDPKPHERQRGTVELAHWLLVARFVAQGGTER